METTNVTAPAKSRKRRFPLVRASAALGLLTIAGSAVVATLRHGKTANSNTPAE